MLRVRLPRASSLAYRQLRQREEEQEEQQADGAEAPQEAQQQPEQAEPQEAAADGQAAPAEAKVAAALNEIKARDAGGLLEAGPGGAALRWAAVASRFCTCVLGSPRLWLDVGARSCTMPQVAAGRG